TLPKKEAEKGVLAQEIAEQKCELQFWQYMTDAWEETFNQEVSYGFVMVPEEAGADYDRITWIERQYKGFLKENNPAKIEEQLTKVFFEQQGNLLEYRMTDMRIPAVAFPWMDEDWDDSERVQIDNWRVKSSRRLIQLDFQGKRVSPYFIAEKVEQDRLHQQTLLDEQDRQ